MSAADTSVAPGGTRARLYVADLHRADRREWEAMSYLLDGLAMRAVAERLRQRRRTDVAAGYELKLKRI